jgi:EmrB/QacA subfamily drug resistance transporter
MAEATSDAAAPAAKTFCPPESRIFVLVAAILASSMGFIDGSVISIATPAIRADLGASLADAQWVSNSYMLFLASLLLIGGAAGDKFGLRNVFSIGIVLFVVASLVCAIAPTPVLLILARAVQGIGAAIMVPGSLAIIAKAYPRNERGKAIGIWAAASSLTTILGPIIGGFILTALGDWSWRLVFAINLPLGGIALALLWLRVPADTPDQGRRLDIVGGILVTAALLFLALGLTGDDSVPELNRALLLCGIAVVLIAAFLFWENRTRSPMMPLRLFSNLSFSGANALTFVLYFSLAAITFYLPMALIAGWGTTPAEVAIALLPLGIALTVLSPFAGRLSDRFGPGPLIAGGSALVALSFLLLGLTAPLMNLWFVVLPLMILFGVGMGFVVSPLSTAVMTGVEDGDTGVASGVNNAVARVAGLLAIATMGAVAAAVFGSMVGGLGEAGTALSFGQIPGGELTDAAVETARVAATNAAFAAVAYITAFLSLLSAIIAWLTLDKRLGAKSESPSGKA